ncbi:SSU ribosomal protein S9p (S16e) [Fulvivirga imtechensis AK7]|uniref:Small ribosomal subunit protein uS9 n=1 Tax=Fulvivirga imtechensis AK7 TaxID=1237149 RepID=L8JXV9_9BACT|nr:30S ribosomal protein S9 [Fulvivirga imtechensis]ELR73013.1 SSU ribosomal protein S9p (S16e) [Fulvivirga imtechensis AK7]
MEVISSIGRRKTSIARVYVSAGKGEIIVNNKTVEDYFPAGILQTIVRQPLNTVNQDGSYDIKVNVDGGGPAGQAEAIRLAVSRALVEIDPEHRSPLKKEGFLTRDPRMVERKKYGRRKARRKFQFSKR